MHSPDSEGTRDAEERADRTVQGTLDEFLVEGPGAPQGARADGVARSPPSGDAAAATATAVGASQCEQRSIDSFEMAGPVARQELEARAPRAAAGLMLERDVERVARREAATGITRDELVIVIAREVQLPLEDLHLVDSYVSDLILEGKLTLAGERVVLTPKEHIAPKARAAPARPGRPAGKTRPAPKGRSGKGRGRPKRAPARPKRPRSGRGRSAPAASQRGRRGKGGGGR